MIIEIPGVGNVEFPDGTPPDVIEGALAQYKTGPKIAPNMEAARAARAGTLTTSPASANRQSAFDAQNIGPLEDSLKTGRLNALGRGLHQGLTFGFGDEIVAAIRPYLHDGETYDSALRGERDTLTQARADRPGYAYGGEIAGALAAPVGAFKSTGKLSLDMLKGAGTGAWTSGLYGAGASEGDMAGRASDAGNSALLGALIGGAIPAIGAGVQRYRQGSANNAAVKAAAKGAPSSDELRAAGNALYREVDDAGVQISPQAFDRMRGNVLDDLRANTGFDELPGPGSLTPNASRVNEIMSAASTKMAAEPTAALPFKALDQMRRQAGAAAGNKMNPTDQKAGMAIISGLDDLVAKIGPDDVVAGDIAALQSALPKARETWARMKKSQIIDDAIDAGGDYLSGAASGIRNQLKNILRNPKIAKGFSEAEKAAMRKVINGSIPEQLLNLASGGLGQMATAIAGGAAGGVPGLALGAGIAAGSRKLAEKVTTGKAETLRAMIANGGIQSFPQISSAPREIIEKLMQRGTAAGLQSR